MEEPIQQAANPENDLIEKANRLIQAGEETGVPLRLLGGLAVRHVSPVSSQHPRLKREYADIDFAGLSRDARKIKEIFVAQSYEPDQRFNALHGQTRLIFYDPSNGKHIDVFLDQFKMCHPLDLRARLLPGYKTLTLADLLVTKLQIIQMNAKDLMDILALLLEHEVGSQEDLQTIDAGYIQRLTGKDWGIYTTLTDNLIRAQQALADFLTPQEAEIVSARVNALQTAVESGEKSLAWRLRARIGRRMEWYELPEEVDR